MVSGQQLAREGADMLPDLFPDRAAWPALSERFLSRAHNMLKSEQTEAVGFFFFGMSEAARGARGYGR